MLDDITRSPVHCCVSRYHVVNWLHCTVLLLVVTARCSATDPPTGLPSSHQIFYLPSTSSFFISSIIPTQKKEEGKPSEKMVRAVIVPGNGGASYPTPLRGGFYGDLAARLEASNLFTEVISLSMPDPNAARRSIWIPHLVDTLRVDKETIVIGHSSGAEACMRLAEEHAVYGIVLVAACHTDLGDAGERASGWYPPSGGPWLWDNMKKNTEFRIQFHSDDDCFIDVGEARFVHQQLETDYRELSGFSHFFEPFDAVVDAVLEKARALHVGLEAGGEKSPEGSPEAPEGC